MKLIAIILLTLGINITSANQVGVAINNEIYYNTVQDLEAILSGAEVTELHPIELDIDINGTVAINHLLMGMDFEMDAFYYDGANKGSKLLTIAATGGYALLNDDHKMVGLLATIGVMDISHAEVTVNEEGVSSFETTDKESGMLVGGRLVAYFSFAGGTIAEVKVLPFDNVFQLVSDIDFHLFQIYGKSSVIKLDLNPRIKYTSSDFLNELDAALFLSVDLAWTKLFSRVFAGVGVKYDYSEHNASPYVTIGIGILSTSIDSWMGSNKKKKDD